MTTDRQNWLQL